MAEKTEFEKDMENLRQLQKAGCFKKLNDRLRADNNTVVVSTLAPKFHFDTEEDLEKIAKKLPEWRKDVDVMEFDDDVIALRGRDQDLDKLVNSTEAEVRAAVALNGRNKDLDKLASDEDKWVRQMVACQGRDKDLDKLISDPSPEVQCAVTKQREKKQESKQEYSSIPPVQERCH